MQIQLIREKEPFHFKITSNNGAEVHLDASTEIGGGNAGFRPTELLLAGAGGCASIDVVLILQKQRQQVDDIQISIKGSRSTQVPKVFETITIHFAVQGNVEEDKLKRAIELSLTKYCSVVLSLNKDITIDYTFKIN